MSYSSHSYKAASLCIHSSDLGNVQLNYSFFCSPIFCTEPISGQPLCSTWGKWPGQGGQDTCGEPEHPLGNPRKHWENMRTPHRKVLPQDSNSGPSCCEATAAQFSCCVFTYGLIQPPDTVSALIPTTQLEAKRLNVMIVFILD